MDGKWMLTWPLTLIDRGWQPGARGERDSEAHLGSLGVMAAAVPG